MWVEGLEVGYCDEVAVQCIDGHHNTGVKSTYTIPTYTATILYQIGQLIPQLRSINRV